MKIDKQLYLNHAKTWQNVAKRNFELYEAYAKEGDMELALQFQEDASRHYKLSQKFLTKAIWYEEV